jgi:hypothetical protein
MPVEEYRAKRREILQRHRAKVRAAHDL